jgi:hypothetical protein
MSDYIILPEHQLKHLTSEGRRQLFCWIHDEGIRYSQFHTADGSIHLEVDGYGFKRFDCNETFADVQRFIGILKHATANQLSWCDAEKTFKSYQHAKETPSLEKEMEKFTIEQLIKQRDVALQSLQNVTIERDELRAEVERLKVDNDELHNILANLK